MTEYKSANAFDIARDCTLVSVEGSLFPWSKRDDEAAANAAAADHTTSDRYTSYVQRLTKEDRLPPQQKLSEARRYLDFPTGFRWDGKGSFAVVNTKLDSVISKLEAFRAEFYDMVDKLCKSLPALRDRAKVDLNGAFYLLGFPTEDEVRERYKFEIKQSAITHPDDIRLNHVSAKARAAIEDSTRKEYSDKVQDLHKQVVEKLEAALSRVVTSLTEFNSGKIARFEDTMVTNLEELVEALPSLNVNNDRSISAAVTRARDLVSGLVRAAADKTLRDKKSDAGTEVRTEIAKQAGDILSKLKAGAVKAQVS